MCGLVTPTPYRNSLAHLHDLNVKWEDNIKMYLTLKHCLSYIQNNNDNNTTPIFIGLHKTTQKHGRRKTKVVQEKIKRDVLRQMYFNVNDENAVTLEYFNLRTNAV
jgi:hypothetical protein